MKKTIFTLVFVMFVITGLISCRPSTKEEIEAKENVEEAKEDLSEARRQANAEEWQSFKNDMNDAIDKNDARIEELKKDIKKTGKNADAEYEEKINALKSKNEDLKEKMKTYKNDADSDWQSFKREFNHDMDELGNAFKDLTVDNKK